MKFRVSLRYPVSYCRRLLSACQEAVIWWCWVQTEPPEKHQSQSLLFGQIASVCKFIKNEILAQMFSWEFYEIFKNTCHYRTPPKASPTCCRCRIKNK